jgi:hypothetical protein
MRQLKTIVIGILAGIISGLLGIGGAIIMVPCMVHFLDLPHHNASATSLAVVIPGAIISAVVYHSFGQLDLSLSAMFAAGGIAGVFVGTSLMPKIKPQVLKRIFAVLTFLIAIKMGVD